MPTPAITRVPAISMISGKVSADFFILPLHLTVVLLKWDQGNIVIQQPLASMH